MKKDLNRTTYPWMKKIVFILALVLAVIHVLNILFMFPNHIILGLHLGFLMVLIFLGKGLPNNKLLAAFEIILLLLAVAACVNYSVNYVEMNMRATRLKAYEVILGCAIILAVLYATYRTIGIGMTAIAIVFLLYVFFGQYLPGAAGHAKYRLMRIVSHMYLSASGIFGSLLSISATYLAIFTLFGTFLENCDASNAFIRLAIKAAGKIKGGPALAAVIASCLFGMVSGAPVVNVVTTGTITIPLMESLGIAPNIAGAIEAAASTGGSIMPPVMGAGAFVMSEVTSIPYSQIVKAAIIPALVYFIGVGSGVFFHVHKADIACLDKSLIPTWKEIGREVYLLVPFVMLLVLILVGYSPIYSALLAIAFSIALLSVRNYRVPKEVVRKLGDAMARGSRSLASIASGLACAGIIVGAVTLTGLGGKFVNMILYVSNSFPFLALVLVALACLVLGMGLPTSAAYVLTATIAGPAMTKLGYSTLASHMFIFYFAVVAVITPPVAITAYAGAGIAKGDPNKTGWNAFFFALPAFLCPFMFMYNSALLAEGNFLEVLWAGITAVIGAVTIGAATQGYVVSKLPLMLRGVMLIGAFLLLKPGMLTDAIGFALVGAIVVYSMLTRKRGMSAPAADRQITEEIIETQKHLLDQLKVNDDPKNE